ncbi:MAG TPA: TauD/TfdA family dioxygenase [Ramlibacter sp.]|nr:TauD/TfdA family dioxygenase [Ramlibacter sp.]
MAQGDYTRIAVKPVAGALGAEIEGVNLAKLDDATFAEIKRAFLEHLVIFFRDQELTKHQLAGVAERFGPLTVIPYVKKLLTDHPFVTQLVREADVPSSERNIGDNWHSDQSPRERPSLGFALYCLDAPEYGGDTMFANLYKAYDALSDGMKAMCERLTVMHSLSGKFGADGYGHAGGFKAVPGADSKFDEETLKLFRQETEHPLVRVHPETGRKLLFVTGPYSIRFANMTVAESKPLLNYLNELVTRPEFTCRFRWRKGSLSIMDNRCTQHYAVNDYEGFRRHMLRVEMEGDRPFGPAMPHAPQAATA